MFRNTFSMKQFRHRLAYGEALPQMVILGILCGLICGLVLGSFRTLLETPLEHLLPNQDSENFEGLPTWLHFLLPIIGSLVLIAILSRVTPLNRKVGITHLLERMAYHQGYLPITNAIIQFFVAALALLFGHSVGKEGPAIHLGAACGSQLGQRLNLPNNTLRILVGCGSAAGIAATFNTPLAGVVFAMEVVLLEYTVIGFMPVMVSAATGALVVQFMFGNAWALTVPTMQIESLQEIPYVAFLGGIIGLLAVIFIALMKAAMQWSNHSTFGYKSRLLLAGVLTGSVAVFYPQVMGMGYDTVTSALQGEIGLGLLFGILIAKCLLTPIVLGLGMPAGLIGPTFFIGAIAGGLLGILGSSAVNQTVAHPGFYALLGMGSMMGAVANAPMAALVAILELTGNPNIIFPAMISIVVSNLIARYVFKMPSIFVISMHLQGMDYRYRPLTQMLNSSSAQSLMNRNFINSDPTISTQGASKILESSPSWLLITEESKYILLSPGDLHTAVQQASSSEELIDLLRIPALRLDTSIIDSKATLQQALEQMTRDGVEALCIVTDRNEVLGLLTRDQIEAFYREN
ncbi:chloride channel protein [Neptuniibacter sp. 1_MG-2023]|uniref:chloride channel protein n=1 Tax=Neptuniibacter sp. 1_MG-2023 TaxID=3062662 RepID=UPI0026E3AB2B|nr:chloride channel protein [Neptuniibacter sp. 1_MG-2023]MDO6595009.1 chloride channel protein [Neptuniibacter sp. 1_MG-2023]